MSVGSKEELRKRMLQLRNSLSTEEIKEKGGIIKSRLFSLPEYKNRTAIAFYLSISGEVDTRSMIAESIKNGKKILVPVTNDEIEFVRFTSFDDLRPAKFNVPEPQKKISADVFPDIVITPGVAFDIHLHRLGYGKGYYDRLFNNIKCIKVGLCYDFQIVDKIPKDIHDKKLDIIITEKRVIRI